MNSGERYSRGGRGGGGGGGSGGGGRGNRIYRGNRNRSNHRGGSSGYMNNNSQNCSNQPKLDNYGNDGGNCNPIYQQPNVNTGFFNADFSGNPNLQHFFQKVMDQTYSAQLLTQQQQQQHLQQQQQLQQIQQQQHLQQQQQIHQQMQHHQPQQQQQQAPPPMTQPPPSFQFQEYQHFDQQPIQSMPLETQSLASSGDYGIVHYPNDNSSINSGGQVNSCNPEKCSPITDQDSGYADNRPDILGLYGDKVKLHTAYPDWFVCKQWTTPFLSQISMELRNVEQLQLDHLTKCVDELPEFFKDSDKVLKRTMQVSYVSQVLARDINDNNLGKFPDELKGRKILDWFRSNEFVECFQSLLLAYAYTSGRYHPAPLDVPNTNTEIANISEDNN